MTTRALWCIAPARAEIRAAGAGEGVEVATQYTGISRGTERLVYEGRVPASEADRMRAPLQEGQFPFPVKYGYALIGEVRDGAWRGRTVFALAPHQASIRVPQDMLVALPQDVPPPRGVLAANMETALNIVWDAQAAAGDRIAVIGAGTVGALVGYLCARLPGAAVTLIDTNPDRARLADRLGCGFARPDQPPRQCDVVVHTSASAAGLATALAVAGDEAAVVEASWYGDAEVPAPLGTAFHSRRLRLLSSQVGRIPPGRSPRWDARRRLQTAVGLLADDRLDALISGETAFDDIAAAYGTILSAPDTLCHRIRYPHAN